jgi:hypothetical protein
MFNSMLLGKRRSSEPLTPRFYSNKVAKGSLYWESDSHGSQNSLEKSSNWRLDSAETYENANIFKNETTFSGQF